MFPNQASGSDLMGGGGSSSTVLKAPVNQYAIQQPNNPYFTGSQGGSVGAVLADTTVSPQAQAAAAAAAANAAKAKALRGNVTSLVNSIKDIFNSRYGLIDQSAGEQTGKLNDRFAAESQDVANQVENENQQLGAAHAASGSYDSSYRGNNVDTVTKAGEGQIRDLGTELEDNIAKIAAWVSSQKAGIDAEKRGLDTTASRLPESDDVNELTSLRNQLESRIAELEAGQAEYRTNAQNRAALEGIAPSSQRAVQLKTTLSHIVSGNADASQKKVIAQRLIQNSGLTPQEQEQLLSGFQADLQKKEQVAQ